MIWRNLAEKDREERRVFLQNQQTALDKINSEIKNLEDNKLLHEEERQETEEILGLVRPVVKKVKKEDTVVTRKIEQLKTKQNRIQMIMRSGEMVERELEKRARKLAEEGLEPIAVLNAGVWEKISRKYLYRFEHMDGQSRTGASVSEKKKCIIAFILTLAILAVPLYFCCRIDQSIGLGAMALAFFSCFLFFSAQFTSPAEGVINTYDCSVFVCFAGVLASLSFMVSQIPVDTILLIILFIAGLGTAVAVCYLFCFLGENFPRMLPARLLTRLLWPDKIDCEAASDEEKIKVNFNVKNPKELIDKIESLRTAGYSPFIAAEEKAIMINKRAVFEAMRKQHERLDPIIYTRHGGTVAIHAQIGEFANEKMVMDWAIKAGVFCSYLKILK